MNTSGNSTAKVRVTYLVGGIALDSYRSLVSGYIVGAGCNRHKFTMTLTNYKKLVQSRKILFVVDTRQQAQA